ncbi:MAG: hypothetical protein Q7R52_05615 [archaeon]|nr:hypothetical protein [archaeon]
MAHNGDIVYFKSNGDFRNIVLNDLLILFEKKSNIKLTNNKDKSNRIAISSTIDFEAERIIDILINDKTEKLRELSPTIKDNKKIIIKPLYLFSDKEILLYAKLRGLKFKPKKRETTNIQNVLDNMENKHPEIKRAIVNSYLKLYK